MSALSVKRADGAESRTTWKRYRHFASLNVPSMRLMKVRVPECYAALAYYGSGTMGFSPILVIILFIPSPSSECYSVRFGVHDVSQAIDVF